MTAMRAMVLSEERAPLVMEERPIPAPSGTDLVIMVTACGVCRTDLHVVDGDLDGGILPIVPGHEIVGRVMAIAPNVKGWNIGDRVGVPWLGGTCGTCRYCLAGRENLCDAPTFTGFSRDGGFATHTVADSRFCLHLPDSFDDMSVSPLLCAGLIGHRAYRKAQTKGVIGLYGFGAAAHIIAQVAASEGAKVFAFTRPGDTQSQAFARKLGATWAGPSTDAPPEPLDAAILFAPVGALVPEALKHIRKGGKVVCAGIHMSDIPTFPYADLWGEREVVSVANLTRKDGADFMATIRQKAPEVHVTRYPLAEANTALEDLRQGRFDGAAVLVP